MKKQVILWALVLMASNLFAQSYETLSLRFVQQKETGWIVLDGANKYTTWNIPVVDTRLKGAAWGSFRLDVRADSIKAGSAQDSLQLWFKELQADTTTVSTFDSTSIGTFNWNTGQWKKYTIIPDVCFGLKLSMKHATTVDDSIKVKFRLIYQ
jgi:hypothetical protein